MPSEMETAFGPSSEAHPPTGKAFLLLVSYSSNQLTTPALVLRQQLQNHLGELKQIPFCKLMPKQELMTSARQDTSSVMEQVHQLATVLS